MHFLQRLFGQKQRPGTSGIDSPDASADQIFKADPSTEADLSAGADQGANNNAGAAASEVAATAAAVVPEWLCDWGQLVKSSEALWRQAKAKPKLKVLLGTVAGGHPVAVAVETLLAAALTLRGADVHILLCDGALPACLQCSRSEFTDVAEFLTDGPQKKFCAGCLQQGMSCFGGLDLPVIRLSDFITDADREDAAKRAATFDLQSFMPEPTDHPAIKQHVHSASMRFLVVGDVNFDPLGAEVCKRYAEAAFLTQSASRKIFAKYGFDCYFSNHPAFVPHGVIKDIAREQNAGTLFWNAATRAGCIHVTREDTAWDVVTRENPALWESMHWSKETESELLAYLSSKWTGARDWIYGDLHKNSERDAEAIGKEFDIDFGRPTIALLTNVVWDAAVFYPEAAFEDHTQWLVETIRYFSGRPDLNLVIRVHPAEVRGTLLSQQTVEGELSRYFDSLPPNVRLIPARSKANTYALVEKCDAAVIFATTTGLELTSMGIPTITAGESFIRYKDISYDARSRAEYFDYLDILPFGARMSPELLTRARKFAYHFNFRRTIPIKCLCAQEGWPPLKLAVSSLEELLPGQDPGLDLVCDAVFQESLEIVYKAEEFLQRV